MRIRQSAAAILLALLTLLSACGQLSAPAGSGHTITLDDLPAYSDQPYVEVNGNEPYFTSEDMTTEAFERYSPLDSLERCGVAYANVCPELMPTEERGEIGMIKPSGWHTVRYDDVVDGKYLYNRCHLIGYQLAGENANEENLITGTRYLNVEGMLPFENLVADYVDETGNHVLYRVTPIFEGDNLVASGVLMEACSVEDEGAGVTFCVYCYNVQPGITIDYATGESWLSGQEPESPAPDASVPDASVPAGSNPDSSVPDSSSPQGKDYVLNTNTMKFHLPDCASAAKISSDNCQTYSGSREELLAQGYSPCGVCKP